MTTMTRLVSWITVAFSLCTSLPHTLAALEPCSQSDVAGFPFCDLSLPVEDRAKDLVSRLETEEKIAQLMMSPPAIDRLHIDAYNWWTESLHGVLAKCTKDGRCPTSYPEPIGIGATFNMKLVKTMARQISSEGRRLFVEDAGQNSTDPKPLGLVGLDFWGPNINIFRDPRWGRGMETPGEDPYLTGQYAVTYVQGMQEGEDPRYAKTIATLKHFAGYSLESWNSYNRINFDAIISDQDLVQTYFPAFEIAIKEGKAGSVMCSYNSVNGVPSCANAFLLEDILREDWGWDGYVVSDCGAIGYVYRPHKYKPTPEEAVSASLKAGTDLNCGSYYQHLDEALKKKLVAEEDLDKALVRLFGARIKLGLFDPWDQQPYMKYPPTVVGHPSHVETALHIARESIVLLKNNQNTLPLDPSNIKKVAVLGPHIHTTGGLCGNYHGGLPTIASPLDAIKEAFPSAVITSSEGCDINSNSTDGFAPASKLAHDADVAIVFVGISGAIEGEGKDRYDIGLPGVQEAFIETIANAQQNTVLVLINGGPLDISAAKENSNVVAILEAFYPGMKGAEAISDVLLGKYNPSGRLPYTIHKKDFVDQISMAEMSMTKEPGRTYRYFNGDVVYAFGYGLSYTSFDFAASEMATISGVAYSEREVPKYKVNVTNTGSRAGDVSVLGFLSFEGNSMQHSCPLSQLFGFQKVHLHPGQSKTIFFSAHPASLKCVAGPKPILSSPTGLYSVTFGNERHYFHYTQELADMNTIDRQGLGFDK